MPFDEQDRFFSFGGHIPARQIDAQEAPFEQLVRLLTPHVQHALEINRTLAARSVMDAASGLSGASPAAVLLLARSGHLLFANDTAQAWLDAGEVIRTDAPGRLGAPSDRVAAFLDRALATLEAPAPAPPATLTLPQPDHRFQVTLRAAPFLPDRQTSSPFGVLHSGATRALLLTLERRALQAEGAEQMLRRLKLTRTEIEVALALSQGLQVKEIAERRQVSVNTVRNQRQSILSKLGLHRQGQLIRLVSDWARK